MVSQKTGDGLEAAKQPLLVYEGAGANVASNGRPAKPRIVILGSGWGAVSVLRNLPKNIGYDQLVCSPTGDLEMGPENCFAIQ